MTKCTPEEAAAMAEKAGLRSWDNRKNITLDQRTARLIDLAREPMTARLEVLEREHTEFFDRWHDERRKREALELERDALAAQVAELREALIYHQEQTRPICKTWEGPRKGYPPTQNQLPPDSKSAQCSFTAQPCGVAGCFSVLVSGFIWLNAPPPEL